MRTSISFVRSAALLAALFALHGNTVAQLATPLELPTRGPDIESFRPAGYRLRIARSGDLNGDGIADHVAVFESANDDPDASDPRLLVVLLGVRGGGLRQAGRSDTAAWPTQAGMRGESRFEDLGVRGRTFEVSNVASDSNTDTRTVTSVFRSQRGGWYLAARREQIRQHYLIPEWPDHRICRRVHTRLDEACSAFDRRLDYRAGRASERWTIEAAQDQPQRQPRTATARWRMPRQPLRRLEEAGDA